MSDRYSDFPRVVQYRVLKAAHLRRQRRNEKRLEDQARGGYK